MIYTCENQFRGNFLFLRYHVNHRMMRASQRVNEPHKLEDWMNEEEGGEHWIARELRQK